MIRKTHELHLTAAAIRASEDGLTQAAHGAAHRAQRVACSPPSSTQAVRDRESVLAGYGSALERAAGAYLEMSRFKPEPVDLWTAYQQWLRGVVAWCDALGCCPRLSADDLPATHPRIHEWVSI